MKETILQIINQLSTSLFVPCTKIVCEICTSRSNEQDIFNAMGSLYTSVLFLGIQNGVAVQPVVATERTVFYREKAAGMYSAIPYAFAQVVTINF